jgi:F-type H+-transporting ATPase subunit delta
VSVQTVARRYATALADETVPAGTAQQVMGELVQWEAMVSGAPVLAEVFRNPTIPADQKRALLHQLIQRTKIGETAANFLKALLHNQRLAELGAVLERLSQVLDERGGVIAASVSTARPVSAQTQADLEARLTAATGKKVRLTFNTDPELIGGIVTRVGSTIYDGSIRTQLNEIKEKLMGERH